MFLGIDLGTSGVKALLIDDEQRVAGEAYSRPLEVHRLHSGWSEQDPGAWWDAVCEAVDGLGRSNAGALSAVRGIGLSGQMYGATVLGDDDRPLRRAILWNDTRTSAECRELEEREPELRRIAGRRATPGVTATKLAWLRKHEPSVFDRVRTVLLPKDYIRLQLTGEKASDMSDSSGTLWMDVGRRAWSDRLLAATALRSDQMPRLVEGTEPTGTLRASLADRWGMGTKPVVAGGGGDNACGACGSGIIQPGAGTVSLGTSGVLFVVTEKSQESRDYAIETLCHAVPGAWHQMSVILSATSCLNWLAKLLKRRVGELVADLGEDRASATPLLFLPYLDGCWSPQDDAAVRGAFVGLDHGTDDATLTRSVMQGVAFALTDAAISFRENGAAFDQLLGIGGGSRSRVWMSMLADCLGVDVAIAEGSELGAAFGAARLGLIAATGAKHADVLTRPRIVQVIKPDPERAAGFREAFDQWRALYAPVRAASAALSMSM
jgi:xylulokinase